MSSTKEEPVLVTEYPIEDVQIEDKEPDDGGIPSKYRGTAADKRDMIVLGKKQVLRVCILDNCISFCYVVPN
jgi:hypothetical protein